MKRRFVITVVRTLPIALSLAHAALAASADLKGAARAQPAAAGGSLVEAPKFSPSRGSSLESRSTETAAYSPKEIAFKELNSVPASPRSGSAIVFLPGASTVESGYCDYVASPSFSVGAADYVLKGMRPTSRVIKDGSRDVSGVLPREAKYTNITDGLADKFEDVRVHYYNRFLASGLDERAVKDEMMRQYERGRAWAQANPEISAELRREVGKNYHPRNTGSITEDDIVTYFGQAGARPKDWFDYGSCMKSPVPQPFGAYVPRKKTMDDLYAEGQARIPALRGFEKQAAEQGKGKELWAEGGRKYLARMEIDDLQSRIAKKARGFNAGQYAQSIEDSLRYHCHL